MALFTGKGDDGTTKTFDCPAGQRVSKDSSRIEALGALDELNSFLGMCKTESQKTGLKFNDLNFEEIIDKLQQDLFIIQAEVAGAEKKITEEKVKWLGDVVNSIEKELPPIKTFFVSGGVELSARLDYARTLARRAERRVVTLDKDNSDLVSDYTKAYLNRLSSVLYALTRLSNHIFGIKEESPDYK